MTDTIHSCSAFCTRPGCVAGREQPEALPEFDDPYVQAAYEILCADDVPPEGEHWEGFAARRIVAQITATITAQAALVERLKMEAQIHAQEARTAKATIAEIYQCVTGATGEPGNWNGAEPVREKLTAQAARIAELERDAARWRGLYRQAINEANGLTNCCDERPELRSAERKLEAIQTKARAIDAAFKDTP